MIVCLFTAVGGVMLLVFCLIIIQECKVPFNHYNHHHYHHYLHYNRHYFPISSFRNAKHHHHHQNVVISPFFLFIVNVLLVSGVLCLGSPLPQRGGHVTSSLLWTHSQHHHHLIIIFANNIIIIIAGGATLICCSHEATSLL